VKEAHGSFRHCRTELQSEPNFRYYDPIALGGDDMPFSQMPGIADPDELKSLELVFEEACSRSHIARSSVEAERMALRIMILFQSGVEDPGRLLEATVQVPDPNEDQAQHLRCG
jgi:hypothetical protein